MKFEVWYLAHGIPKQYLLPRLEHFGQSQWYHQSSCSCVFHLPALEKMGARPDRIVYLFQQLDIQGVGRTAAGKGHRTVETLKAGLAFV